MRMQWMMKVGGAVACVALGAAVHGQTNGGTKAGTKPEQAAMRALAAQSVLHVETSLQKINAAGPTGDKGKMQREVIQPAGVLAKEWRQAQLTDQQMQPYIACQGMLGDIQVYSADALAPPKYHLSPGALQKLKFITEDLAACRKVADGKKPT